MKTIKSFVESRIYAHTVLKLKLRWKKAIRQEQFDEALNLASEIIALDESKALGWWLKASVYVRMCPSSPPDPKSETKALELYDQAFSRDKCDRRIAHGYIAFAHWVGADQIARRVIAEYRGKRNPPPFHLEGLLEGISTRGRITGINEATGAFESMEPGIES